MNPGLSGTLADAAVPLAALAVLPLLHIKLQMPEVLLAVSAILLFALLDRRRCCRITDGEELAELRRIMEAASARIRSGKPLAAALESALRDVQPAGAAAAILRTALSRMHAGEAFGDAVMHSVSRSKGRCSAAAERWLASMASYFGTAGSMAIERFIAESKKESAEAEERRIGSLQRSATVSMVAGTVIPSFITFGLAGYSIMYFQSAGIGALAVVLLVMVTGAYRVSNGWMDGAQG